LYSFPGGASGSNPCAGLVADSSGNLCGTTGGGGNSTRYDLGSGCGTVFKLAPAGFAETVLYSFQGGPTDGASPRSNLLFDTKGALYGTRASGGASGECTRRLCNAIVSDEI
jgi:uncharacterized repeat protein (TIGR03803 family)